MIRGCLRDLLALALAFLLVIVVGVAILFACTWVAVVVCKIEPLY